MQTDQAIGLAHFLAQTDSVGLGLFIVLLAMSVLSWTVILRKAKQTWAWRRSFRHFMQKFEGASNWDELLVHSSGAEARHAALLMVQRGVNAPANLRDAAMAHAIDDQASRMESGQTCLASVASSAPFVGLFGTVWGIYHALVSIAATGQSSLDQVAGPVGEALIMTAVGLAVALPAAVAYNMFQRLIRTQLASLERLAHAVSIRMASNGARQGG